MPELMSPKQKVDSLRQLLERMKPEMALALPKHMTADRMARIALTACLRTPKLLECDPASFAGSVLMAAQIGLEPDGRDAHLVPFRNTRRGVTEVQLIPDYKGFLKLARNSGQIKMVDFREVRAGDKFEYTYGTGAYLKHIPDPQPVHTKDGKEWKERGITHCYALATLTSGESVFEVMAWPDIEWHRDRYSRAAGDGPWVTNPADMGAKTCVRKLYKKLPSANSPMRLAVELDEKAEQGIPQDLGAGILSLDGEVAKKDEPGVTAPAGNGKLDQLTEELKKNGKKEPEGRTHGEAAPGAVERATAADAAADVVTPVAPGDTRTAEGPQSGETAAEGPGSDKVVAEITVPSTSKLLDRVHALYDDVGLAGVSAKAKNQRSFMWTRYVGAGVKEEDAAPEKLQALIEVLEGLAKRKEKK